MTAEDNDSKKYFFCPGCFAEIELSYLGAFSKDEPYISKCPVCGDKLLDVPEGAIYEVRWHARKLHAALHPVAENEEEKKEDTA